VHSVSGAAGLCTCIGSLFCASMRYFSHRLQLLLHAPPNLPVCPPQQVGTQVQQRSTRTRKQQAARSTNSPSRLIVMFPAHAPEMERSAVPNLANKPLNLHPFALAASRSRRSQALLAPGSFGPTIVKGIPLIRRGECRRFHLLRAVWAMRD
jgi:hypothetical protein